MNFKEKLSERIHLKDIYEMMLSAQNMDSKKKELYQALFDTDDKVAYQAAWVFTHFSLAENRWLYDKQNELIDEALVCVHPGKRRLLLTLIFRQPPANPLRTDFLDFCLTRMISKQELPAVQSLCMKLAYEMCRQIPELRQELHSIIELMEPDLLSVAMKSARNNVLKAMKTGKSMQQVRKSSL